jgi:hypothetical protein
VAIRIVVINDQSFWQDEALTAYEAQLPLGTMMKTVVHVETTPRLCFVVIWASRTCSGTAPSRCGRCRCWPASRSCRSPTWPRGIWCRRGRAGADDAFLRGLPGGARGAVAAVERPWGVSIMYRRATVDEGLLAGAALLAIAVLLLIAGGDRRTWRGAAVAGALAGLVWVAPLVLGLLGHDHFLSRNVMPAVVALGAACTVRGARALGAALAVALLAMFVHATMQVQTTPYLQRPDWRAVAHALGPPPCRARSSPPTARPRSRSRFT